MLLNFCVCEHDFLSNCREWKVKVDLVDDDDMDTLEFTERKTFFFSPELSAPLTGDEELTMIHPLVAVRCFINLD